MRRRGALIVVHPAPARNRRREDLASVQVEGRVPRSALRGGKGADAQEAGGLEVGEEVDVQVLVGALAQRRLHGRVVVARGPVVVHGEVGADQVEGDAVGVVASV